MAPRTASHAAAELALDWLEAKQALESAVQAKKGHSDRARRADLARWADVLAEVLGRSPTTTTDAPLSTLRLGDLSTENLTAAIGRARQRWSEATVNRMLSTLRGWCRWLARTGHLPADPTEDELLRVPRRVERRPRNVEPEDLERLLRAAQQLPSGRQRLYWPTRDVAILRWLATSGARAEETCGVTIGEIDRRAERPIWRVNTAKGGKHRDVPLPRVTVDALDAWLAERTRAAEDHRPLPARRADPLFVRLDGSAFSPQALDRLIRGLAARAGIVLPTGAAAHAFRHHYGVTLALRGVPQPAISQLMGHADPRTTSIYTTVAAQQLIGVLDDAGLL